MKNVYKLSIMLTAVGLLYSNSVSANLMNNRQLGSFDKGLSASKLDSTMIDGKSHDIFYNRANGDLFLTNGQGLKLSKNQIPMVIFGNVLIFDKTTRKWSTTDLGAQQKIDISGYKGLNVKGIDAQSAPRMNVIKGMRR